MTRARTVVKRALITANIVSPKQDPSDTESSHGLHELNLLIDSLNNDGLWPYTPMYKDYTPIANKSDFTIGEGEGKTIKTISSDGFTVTVITNREADYYDDSTMTIVDTENFNTSQSKPVSIFSPSQFSFLEDYAVAITSTTDGAGFVTVVTSDPHGYTTGDEVRVTDNVSYDQTDTCTVTDTTTFTLPITLGADYTSGVTASTAEIIVKADETTGYNFNYGDSIPDIRAPRPRNITDIILSESSQNYALKYQPHTEFDTYGYLKSSGRPYTFTYVPSSPFGVLKFDRTFGSAYPFTVKYEQALLTYDLDTEVTKASGYEGFFQYQLAMVLGAQYGKNMSGIASIAKGYHDRLLTNNAINLETVADTDSPLVGNRDFDILNDRHR
jgi:hypothetical protein